MKRCELCRAAAAAMYCESDSASLCWECDGKVHSANFLVQRHSRSLLCRNCSSPTPWSASGSTLPRTISLCHSCLPSNLPEARHSERVDTDDDDDDDEDFDSGDDDDDDNQVVPWALPPPPPSSDSSGEESPSRSVGFSSKRLRNADADCCYDDDFGCSSTHQNITSFTARDREAVGVHSLNRSKRLRTQSDPAIVESRKR